MAVAEQVFLESGFSDTTMQAVALRAGASKETLYRHFGSKEELFGEIVANRARRLLARLDDDAERPGSMAGVLRDLGINLLDGLTNSEAIPLLRIVVAETSRDTALGRIFYSAGPARALSRLTDFLTAARDRGEFTGPNPGRAAAIFLGALMANFHTARLVLVDMPPIGRSEIEAHVEDVVAMFLHHYGRSSA